MKLGITSIMAMLGAQAPGGIQTIRAQAKKEKAAKAAAQVAGGDKASADKLVTRAVLASPLTVPWSVPRPVPPTMRADRSVQAKPPATSADDGI